MPEHDLSFSELEARIRAMPDGPSSVLNMPRWMPYTNGIGIIGMVIGLLPALLLRHFGPQPWMVPIAEVGLVVTYLAFAPYVFYGIAVVGGHIWRWKTNQPKQWDHDLAEFRTLNRWLVGFSRESLEDHLRFARLAQARLTSKLGLLVGAIEKLGVAPIVVAVAIQFESYRNPGAIPAWKIYVALFLVLTYGIAWLGARMRLRLELYESMLAEAADKKGHS